MNWFIQQAIGWIIQTLIEIPLEFLAEKIGLPKRYLWLVAALVFLALGFYFYPSEPVKATPPPVVTAPRIPETKSLPPPAPVAKKEEPREVAPSPAVKQVGEKEWKVFLPNRNEWFDTRIPLIAGNCFRILSAGQGGYLTKLNDQILFPDGPMTMARGIAGACIEIPRASDNYKATIKLKTDDEYGKDLDLLVEVWTQNGKSGAEGYPDATPEAIDWAEKLRASIARR